LSNKLIAVLRETAGNARPYDCHGSKGSANEDKKRFAVVAYTIADGREERLVISNAQSRNIGQAAGELK